MRQKSNLSFADLPFADLLHLSSKSLATTGADGEPHAAAVYFAVDEELNLYFFSDAGSQHSRDLAREPRAAATIYPECRGWQDIQGLQLRGEVRTVEAGPGWDRAWEVYARKFPFVLELREVVARNQFYVFSPHWIRWVDNRRGFGFKEEWVREGGAVNAPAWRRVATDASPKGGRLGGA